VVSTKIFGQPDADPTLLNSVLTRIDELGVADTMLLCHQRVPINSKPCQHPGSLTYEVVIDGRARRAHQTFSGKIELDF
jgi:hypothetical protein